MVSKWSTLKEIQKHTSDWKIVKLNDFSTEAKNSFVNGPFGSDLLSSELTNEGRPVVYIRDIQKGSYRNKSNICITEEKFESLPSCQVVFGDVIISKVGTPPCEAAIYDSKISGIVTQDVIRIRCEELPQSIFLKYLLNSDIGKRQVQQIKISGTRERVSLTDFKKIRLPQPTINEQQKIAKILSTWDKAISTTERLIENSTQQKKALMQQLLTGKKRLLDDEGKRFEGEWKEILLGSCADLTAGGTPSTKKSEYWGGEIPWMNSGEVNLKQVFSVEGRITQAGLDNSSTKIIPTNSILIALAGQGKTRGTVAINRIKLCTNQSIAAIMPHQDILDHDFLYFNLDGRYEELRAMSTGAGGRGGLNLSILKSITLNIPTFKEQQKVATVLTNADKEIELLEQQLADLQQEKKALMQVLLTGKKRVTLND